MNEDQMMTVIQAFAKGDSFMQLIVFGYHLVWLIIAYILYQLFRLKFLKIFIAECITSVIAWVWLNRQHFITLPEEAINNSHGVFTFFVILDFVIRSTPIILGTIAAVMGLRYLQNLWKEKKHPQPVK